MTNISNEFRSILYNPISIGIIKFFAPLLFSENNHKIFVIFRDLPYFLGIEINGNIGGGLYFSLAFISQLIYYYNYKNDIKPTFIKVLFSQIKSKFII